MSAWKEERSSIENATYMTNKWHYFYAYHSTMAYLDETYEGDFNELNHLEKGFSLPCYVECKVPKNLLVMDEDFMLTNFMKRKIKVCLRKNKEITYDPLECLAEYGTVGVLGGVASSMIASFTVLGDPDLIKYITDEESLFHKEWYNWQLGKGKGKIKLRQLLEKEAESDLNGTWWVQEVKKNKNITFGVNPSTGKMAMYQS